MRTFSNEEFLNLSRSLEKFHGVFYVLWNHSQPQFTDRIPTAAVLFNKSGDVIDFLINPDFWDGLTDKQKEFVICHECLHVLLNHGKRTQNSLNHIQANYAIDIVVNHTLVERFGLNRQEIDPNNEYCWVDTVFPGQQVEIGKTFEYYYNLLENNTPQGGGLVDDHTQLPNSDFNPVIDRLTEELSPEEQSAVHSILDSHDSPSKGNSKGNAAKFANPGVVKKKKKWETVIKKWAKQYMNDEIEELWTRPNRRMLLFPGELMIPVEDEKDNFKVDKIEVAFFQDTSGSCGNFIDRFFTAALSLPKDKFDVKMFCFDTHVYETTLESRKLYGFGGTSYTCIEEYIQKYMKDHNRGYFQSVWIVTDGFGDRVQPAHPGKWHWFLSTNYFHCIPKESNIYRLEDFE